MDRAESGWGEEGSTEETGGTGPPHDYYCPVFVGATCTCAALHNNNNDYTKLRHKQSSHSNHQPTSYGGSDPPFDPYSGLVPPTEPHYFGDSGYCSSPSIDPDTPPYPPAASRRPCPESCSGSGGIPWSPRDTCEYCTKWGLPQYSEGLGGAPREEAQPPPQPKIQVTAKILFGSVTAISDLKQRKANKRN